jgi:phosphoribosylanthranilate isomerase
MLIKICGLQRKNEIEAANPADYVGLVIGTPESKRNIDFQKAENLLPFISNKSVLVTTNTNKKYISQLDMLGADVIQLHGKAREFKNLVKNSNVALAISAEEYFFNQYIYQIDLDSCKEQLEYIVIDTMQIGGTGKSWEWTGVKKLNDSLKILVAGGININNFRNAILETKADGLDVSSSLEINGSKSIELIEDFLEGVRA